jgi:hypothetical protein
MTWESTRPNARKPDDQRAAFLTGARARSGLLFDRICRPQGERPPGALFT